MMKALLLSLLMATGLHAADATFLRPWEIGTQLYAPSGSATYALNNVSQTVSSGAIDLSGRPGVFVQLTNSGQSNLTTVMFSGDNASYVSAYTIDKPGSFFIPSWGNYLKLTSSYVGATYTGRASARYWFPGGVTGTAGSGISSNTSSFLPSLTTTYSASNTSASVFNVTATATTAGPCLVCLSSNGGAAGFKVQWGTSATAPVNLTSTSVGHYIAASTTGQCWGPFKAGTHGYIAGVGGTSSVIADFQTAQ